MEPKQTWFVVLIILIIIIVLIIVLRKDRKCSSDSDCQGGVCHDGTCVQCAFDSDCCGSLVCTCNTCVIIPEGAAPPPLPPAPTCDAVTFQDICFDRFQLSGTNGDTFTINDLDLKPFALNSGSSPIDWSTFTFGQIDWYIISNTAPPGTDRPECNEMATVPWNTRVEGLFPLFHICLPGFEGVPSAPGESSFQGLVCSNAGGSPNGATIDVTFSHDNDGIVTQDWVYTGPGGPDSFVYWRVAFTVETEDGCEYGSILYLQNTHAL